jgi:hypothetical protein
MNVNTTGHVQWSRSFTFVKPPASEAMMNVVSS